MKAQRTIVIGGGVIGLAVAWELLRRGREVLVLERRRPGEGATRVAAGMLAPVSEAEDEESERIRLALDSKRRYPDFIAELERRTGLECAYRPAGTLWVAVNRDEAEELRHMSETLAAKDLSFEPWSPERVREEEPHLSARVVKAFFLAEDHHLDPRKLTALLVAAVEGAGGRIENGVTVRAVREEGGRVGEVVAEDAAGAGIRLHADEVVLAAGAWSTTGIESPVSDAGVRPVRGQMVHLRGPALLQHVVRTPEVYFVPRPDGELLVGSTMEEQGFREEATGGGVLDILRHAWLVLPGIYDLVFSEVDAGFRPAVRDHFPVVGPSGTDGLYLALGHFRSGILLAPATAHYLAVCMTEGRLPSELEPFQLERLRSGREA